MTHLIETWGYWGVALFVLSESLGIPLPGETALILAGAYAGRTHNLSPWLIFAVGSVSAVVGGQIGFAAGRTAGYNLVRRFGHKIRIDERKLRTARYLFDTYGVKVVFCGRFVSVLRTYVSLLAGISRMRTTRFTAANTLGAITWAGVFTYASYVAGNTLLRTSGTLTYGLVAVAIAVLITTVVVGRRRMEGFAVAAEAEYADAKG